MVCRFIDGFDYYDTNEITRKYINRTTIISNTDTRTGAGKMRFSNLGLHFEKSFEARASWVVGFAVESPSLSDGTLTFNDNTSIQCRLLFHPSGAISVQRGTTVISGAKTGPILRANNWYFIEMKVTIANSIAADSCIVRVNGVEVINVPAGEDLQATANATANIIGFVGSLTQHDDTYIFDTTGSENNDFVGDVKVATHWPDGNGTTSDFVGSDGNSVDNYLLVDEALTDDDSTYTESSTPGEIDLYTFDDLATTPDTIFAVQVNNVTKKTDAGPRTMRSVTRPASTNFFGVSKAVSYGSYINTEEVYDLDPETDLAWTESGFNATEFGVEIET